MPVGECGGESCFVGLRERARENEQSSSSLSLRSGGDIPRDDLHLMELTHLYRYILKYLEESSSSVDDGREEGPALLFENLSAISIVGHEFTCDFVPPKVLRKRPGTEDAGAIVATPEGRIGDHDGRMRCDL